jgi:hypothetical protein
LNTQTNEPRRNKIMVEKQPKAPAPKSNPVSKQDQRKPNDKAAVHPTAPVAVDRPGFDLGGSTGKTSAGTGLGLGQDAFEKRRDRSLPGRRGKST